MPVYRYSDIKLEKVAMEGVRDVTKAVVIGPEQGWEKNALRVFRIAPGGFTPHHDHDWEHVNYIIKGKGTLTIGEETFQVAANDFAFVPPGMSHQFRNPFDEDFEFICIIPSTGQ